MEYCRWSAQRGEGAEDAIDEGDLCVVAQEELIAQKEGMRGAGVLGPECFVG